MDRKKKYSKWQVVGIVFLTLLAIVGIFCAVVGVMSYCHNVGFVEEIVSWLPAKPVNDPVVSTSIAIIKLIC